MQKIFNLYSKNLKNLQKIINLSKKYDIIKKVNLIEENGSIWFCKIFRVNKSISIDLGTANILIYDKQRKNSLKRAICGCKR